MRRLSLISLLTLHACGPMLELRDGRPSPTACTSSDECGLGEACRDQRCRAVCEQPEDCAPHASCEAGLCVRDDEPCRSGARRCNMLDPELCDDQGNWVPQGATCMDSCREGYCAVPLSCDRGATCGAGVSCCESRVVPAGTLFLHYKGDADDDAVSVERKVSAFALDRFEVTAERFDAFLNAYDPAILPKAGEGAPPRVPESGWNADWNEDPARMPPSAASLLSGVLPCGQNLPPAESNLPMRCVNWYLAFAFCIWDGGRLPTEAEWTMAASGGFEDRHYPWSISDRDHSISDERATYWTPEHPSEQPEPVGSHPAGAGKFGHEDLAGNVLEWTLDWYHEEPSELPCHGAATAGSEQQSIIDCVELQPTHTRLMKGGSYLNSTADLTNSRRLADAPSSRQPFNGFRCAHDL